MKIPKRLFIDESGAYLKRHFHYEIALLLLKVWKFQFFIVSLHPSYYKLVN